MNIYQIPIDNLFKIYNHAYSNKLVSNRSLAYTSHHFLRIFKESLLRDSPSILIVSPKSLFQWNDAPSISKEKLEKCLIAPHLIKKIKFHEAYIIDSTIEKQLRDHSISELSISNSSLPITLLYRIHIWGENLKKLNISNSEMIPVDKVSTVLSLKYQRKKIRKIYKKENLDNTDTLSFIFFQLQKQNSVESLKLNSIHLTYSSMQYLSNFESLKSLEITNALFFKLDVFIRETLPFLSNLEKLHLDLCIQDHEAVLALLEHLKDRQLKQIKLQLLNTEILEMSLEEYSRLYEYLFCSAELIEIEDSSFNEDVFLFVDTSKFICRTLKLNNCHLPKEFIQNAIDNTCLDTIIDNTKFSLEELADEEYWNSSYQFMLDLFDLKDASIEFKENLHIKDLSQNKIYANSVNFDNCLNLDLCSLINGFHTIFNQVKHIEIRTHLEQYIPNIDIILAMFIFTSKEETKSLTIHYDKPTFSSTLKSFLKINSELKHRAINIFEYQIADNSITITKSAKNSLSTQYGIKILDQRCIELDINHKVNIKNLSTCLEILSICDIKQVEIKSLNLNYPFGMGNKEKTKLYNNIFNLAENISIKYDIDLKEISSYLDPMNCQKLSISTLISDYDKILNFLTLLKPKFIEWSYNNICSSYNLFQTYSIKNVKLSILNHTLFQTDKILTDNAVKKLMSLNLLQTLPINSIDIFSNDEFIDILLPQLQSLRLKNYLNVLLTRDLDKDLLHKLIIHLNKLLFKDPHEAIDYINLYFPYISKEFQNEISSFICATTYSKGIIYRDSSIYIIRLEKMDTQLLIPLENRIQDKSDSRINNLINLFSGLSI